MSATDLRAPATAQPLTSEALERIDAYWRAANYLSVGQIYLLDNPLLREPLRLEHVKPRLLGHGGPGLVANAYLEGTYSEIYRDIGQDIEGMRRLFRQFSFPGGIPSHVAP